MTKKIIIALVLAVAVAAIALPSFASHSHEANKEGNIMCSLCKGTGLSNGGQGPFRCNWCNGTGFRGGY